MKILFSLIKLRGRIPETPSMKYICISEINMANATGSSDEWEKLSLTVK